MDRTVVEVLYKDDLGRVTVICNDGTIWTIGHTDEFWRCTQAQIVPQGFAKLEGS